MTDVTLAPAMITLIDYSATVGTTSVQILTPGQLPLGTRFLRISNSGGGSGWIWFARTGAAGANAIASYPLPPGSEERWDGNFIPANRLWAISTQPNTLLVVEAG